MKKLQRMIRPSLALAMILVGAPVFAESSGACAEWEAEYGPNDNQDAATCIDGVLESECEEGGDSEGGGGFFPDKTCEQAISELDSPIDELSWDGACDSDFYADIGGFADVDCFLVAMEDGEWGPDDFCEETFNGEYLGDGSTCSQSVPTLPDTAVGILLLVLFVIAWAQLRRKTAAPPGLT